MTTNASNIEQRLEAAAVGSVALAMDSDRPGIHFKYNNGHWMDEMGDRLSTNDLAGCGWFKVTHIIPAEALAQYEVKHDN